MTAKPRILMVGPWPPTTGGITTFMRNVAASPLKDQYDFVPFTTSRPGKRNVVGDNYGYMAMFRGGLWRVLQGILITLWHLTVFPLAVMRHRPAVVQVHSPDFQAFWEAALYLVMARLLRRPVVYRIGGSFNRFWDASGPRVRALIARTLNAADVLVVQSEHWRRYVVTHVGRGGPIMVVNNFVSATSVVERVEARPAVPRFLLYAGENPRLKGAYVVFEALRLLVSRGIDVDVTLMAVTGPLRDEIAQAGLNGMLTQRDFLSHAEVQALLRRTDVFLQISYSEGFPNTLLEAMAAGCTAIATPVGAVPEVVGDDGVAAFVIEAGDAGALADRMARFATEPGLVAAMAARAGARLNERFTDVVVARALDQAYRLAQDPRALQRPE